jgi:cytochrome P450
VSEALASRPAHVPADREVDFDLFDDRRYANAGSLHAGIFDLAEERPRGIYWTPRNSGHWFLTDHELIFAAARNPELFSNARMTLPPMPEALEPRLIPLTLDPPSHSAYRLPLMRAFSPAMVAALEPAVRAHAIRLIEAIAGDGRCDFVRAIAEPLPVIIFMRLMGMDPSRLAECRAWALDMISNDDHRRADSFVNVGRMMRELILARQAAPQDDLISRLVASEIDGRAPAMDELIDYCLLLFIAGLDTVANSLSFGMEHLARDPDLQARLRAAPASIPDAVEELLRRYGVVVVMRLITRDASFGGVGIKAGDRIMLLLPAGNLDPAVFAAPDQVVIEREGNPHLSFNSGPHRCVGSHLARLELRLFYEEWFRRMPEVRIDPAVRITMRAGLTLGLNNLPLLWDADASR